MVEWCVVRCGCKNKCQKDICLKEIELCARSTLTMLGSIVNVIVRVCVCWGGGGYLIFTRIFALTTKEIFIRALEIMRNTVAAVI